MIHVAATIPHVGAMLGMLVADDPTRFAAFLKEAERVDQAYKRWEYVRGVQGAPGAGANLVGRLPPDLRYTGFEGYWAGSGKSADTIVAEEARLGVTLMHAVAHASGTEHALAAGLDILQNPRARSLYDTAMGRRYDFDAMQRLEPAFGELLAQLRAIEECCPAPQQAAAFQAAVDGAVQPLGASVYIDPVQNRLLSDLAREGKNVEGVDIEERYDIPRAHVTNQRPNAVSLQGAEQQGYHLLSEIGRLGHPIVRALLHIAADWQLDEPERVGHRNGS
jgi:hypothetical protein